MRSPGRSSRSAGLLVPVETAGGDARPGHQKDRVPEQGQRARETPAGERSRPSALREVAPGPKKTPQPAPAARKAERRAAPLVLDEAPGLPVAPPPAVPAGEAPPVTSAASTLGPTATVEPTLFGEPESSLAGSAGSGGVAEDGSTGQGGAAGAGRVGDGGFGGGGGASCWAEVARELSRRAQGEVPRAVRQRGLAGEVVVAFELGAGGVVKSASVEKSSGHALLDAAALALLGRPFVTSCRGEGRWPVRWRPAAPVTP